MSVLSNDTKNHTTKSRETIPLRNRKPNSSYFIARGRNVTWVEDDFSLTTITVARFQHGVSANFGQMRKNSEFFQKYVFTAMNDKIRIKMACFEILSQKKYC
jgi:hypothetical protein